MQPWLVLQEFGEFLTFFAVFKKKSYL